MTIDDDYSQADDAGKKLLERAREFIGLNVRLVDAPKSRIGTIEDARLDHGRAQYLFHLDSRFKDRLPDFYLEEGDFEQCECPTDEYVNGVNYFMERGS
jgi:hypothetical protein